MFREMCRYMGNVLLLGIVVVVFSCRGDESGRFDGRISIDGSSTVYPITEAVAEEFRYQEPGVRVTIGVSGTGGGFKKFARKEIDVADASREIKQKEAKACKNAGLEYVELSVAYDGLAVLVNRENDWVDYFTVEELKKIWEPAAQGKIMKWNQVRSSWPDKEMHLFGPGIASGTYDYFTSAVVGESGASRGDYTASEDDNVLVQGISGDPYALGFFGYAYYKENKDLMKVVGVHNGTKIVLPNPTTIRDGSYSPLSRPLFVYVNSASVQKQEVVAFMDYYMRHVGFLSEDVGYVGMQPKEYEQEYDKMLSLFPEAVRDSLAGTFKMAIPENF